MKKLDILKFDSHHVASCSCVCVCVCAHNLLSINMWGSSDPQESLLSLMLFPVVS